jgi:FkbM family methyltransferase
LPIRIIGKHDVRTPSVQESLAVFKNCFGEPIRLVLDVGAQAKTQFLMDAFADAHHVLFEPVQIYHAMLEANYSAVGISHELVRCAVSDLAGEMHQHLLSSDLSGKVTHSQLLPQADPGRFGNRLLQVIPTPVITLDGWAAGRELPKPYVVKIDVDGIEDLIIAGGRQVISECSLVVVEATLSSIAARVAKLQSYGMRLFDIVGNGYYFEQLQQVDLVFVSEQAALSNIEFQPWKKHGQVIWEHWQQY